MTTNPTGGDAASAHFVCTVDEFLAATPTERLLLVQRQIHETPERWNQESWIEGGKFDGDDDGIVDVDEDNPHKVTVNCGARMCIAGWTVVLAGDAWVDDMKVMTDTGLVTAEDRARKLLDLNAAEAEEMFYGFTGDGHSPESLDELDDIIARYTS